MEDATGKYDYQNLGFRLTDLTNGRKATCMFEEKRLSNLGWSVTIETWEGELLSRHFVPTQEEASKMASRLLGTADD